MVARAIRCCYGNENVMKISISINLWVLYKNNIFVAPSSAHSSHQWMALVATNVLLTVNPKVLLDNILSLTMILSKIIPLPAPNFSVASKNNAWVWNWFWSSIIDFNYHHPGPLSAFMPVHSLFLPSDHWLILKVVRWNNMIDYDQWCYDYHIFTEECIWYIYYAMHCQGILKLTNHKLMTLSCIMYPHIMYNVSSYHV